MALALSNCEYAASMRRQGLIHSGWKGLQVAIEAVVQCGCDRDLWPELVQEMVGTHPEASLYE